MEGVEDIPEIVMKEGIPWNWETFPEYLDALAARSFDIDVATMIPHSPIRVYVMGQRGSAHEASSAADRTAMTRIVADAVRSGAIGVSTSRSLGHRLKDGTLAPSVSTADDEVLALAKGLRETGSGVFQLITDVAAQPEVEIAFVQKIAETARRPVSFTLLQPPRAPDSWRALLAGVERANRDGLEVRGQVFPRPIGVLFGLNLSYQPFSTRPAYKAIAQLPLAQRVSIMRDTQFKAKLLAEAPVSDPQPMINELVTKAALMFELRDPVDYAPPSDCSIGSRAKAAGVSAESLAYDLLLQDHGEAILYLPGANFVDYTLDSVRQMMAHPNTILGLGDGGAHYGLICDASFTTYVLTHWVRDVAAEQRFSLEWAVAELSRRPAEAVGLTDRGLIAPGLKADLNVIDYQRLTLFAPRPTYDLPAGGRRLRQRATGYVATIVNGAVTYANGQPTGALPGRLVRGGGYAQDASSARARGTARDSVGKSP
jgi:N-acyl-D-aspartate/D-glutamate deacylase